MCPHLFKVESGSGLSYDTLLAGSQYGHLRKFVNNHKYTVVAMLGRRKARDIVHGDGFPVPVRSRQASLLNSWLGDGTSSPRSDVFSNIMSKVWLEKMLL